MSMAQITLTQSESQVIKTISLSNGKTQEEIVHEALEQFFLRYNTESRLAALRQACGLWQERQDLPDFSELRKSLTRL